MSTQLIVYPQNYNGYNSTMGFTANEFVVDGINFTSINASTDYISAGSVNQHLLATPPTIVNTWFRWRSTSYTLPLLPAETGGNLVINAAAPYSNSGVYQKLDNLVVGAVYTITVDIKYPVAGWIELKAFNGNNSSGISGSFSSSLVSQETLNFTAQTTNDIIAVLYFATPSNLTISNISVSATNISPTLIYTDLQDGQVICDLYQEEDIPLTLSIDDFKNVAEKVQSYSKDFNLPATKRNNRIFNNMFEVTRTAHNTLEFNPYVQTRCVLKQDGFILFEGYLRMLDAKDKDGEISYNVNLYSEVIALADVLKDQTFSDLDFTELEHAYNKTQIKYSWNPSGTGITYTNPNTSGFRDANDTLKYPFIDWTHQYIIADNPTAASGPTDGNPQLITLEQTFRPCIQLKYLINRIFAATNQFNFTSNFFNSADFEKLYMDFNWGADNAPVVFDSSGELTNLSDVSLGTSMATLDFDSMVSVGGTSLSANFGYSSGVFTAQEDGQVYTFDFDMVFNRSIIPDTLFVQWLVNGIPVYAATSTSVLFPYSGNFTTGVGGIPPLQAGDTVLCQAYSTLGQYELDGVYSALATTPSLVTITTTSDQTTTDTLLGTLRGELGQWDFLKGIMTMFNLVSMVDENDPENILIEPYADIFINNTNGGVGNLTLADRGVQHDWTEKIDVSQMELKPLTDLNKNTIFQFVEDEDDYAFRVYKNSTSGHLYGSKELDASTATNGLPTVLHGTKEIIAEPFAATVSKPLDAEFSMFIVPSLYALNDDGTSSGFENSPRIFYDNGIKSTGASYYIPEQNGVSSENQTDFLQFSHLSSIPSTGSDRDFVFESVQLFPGVANIIPTDNLYSMYWQPYFNELYNADTRTMTLKVNLSPSDVSSFKFYDTVFIKSRVFRVNKIEYKPNDLATVEFILIP